ncbi:MAG TPA: hypothetical protein VF211_16630 [Burkholderiales bacterium]
MPRRTPKPVKGFAATRSSRGIIKRAAADLAAGRENTECRPGRSSPRHCALPGKKR